MRRILVFVSVTAIAACAAGCRCSKGSQSAPCPTAATANYGLPGIPSGVYVTPAPTAGPGCKACGNPGPSLSGPQI